MVLIRFASALVAASMLLTAVVADDTPSTTIKNPITTPTVTKPASALVDVGCFETGLPLENHGPYNFQSPGNCQLVCLQEGKNVMGLSDGENCWCGDKIPAKSWQISNSTCDTTCAGDRTVRCGGPNKLWVVLTGNTRNKPEFFDPGSVSSSAKSSSTAATSAASAVTSSSAPSSAAPKEESKPNTAGIAAGVVVGIVGLASIVGGVFFFLRRRRQKQAEEDYRRNAANVDSFVSGGKLHTSNSSMNDSRIDPSFMDRRQSNGSIADNEDYSRRILKVTNV